MSTLEDLIAKLDVRTPEGRGQIHVYYLQYANAEELAQVLVAAFRHAGGFEGGTALFLVVMDVEVFGLEDAPLEAAVLDLVLTELSGGWKGEGREEEGGRECGQAKTNQRLGSRFPHFASLEPVPRATGGSQHRRGERRIT